MLKKKLFFKSLKTLIKIQFIAQELIWWYTNKYHPIISHPNNSHPRTIPAYKLFLIPTNNLYFFFFVNLQLIYFDINVVDSGLKLSGSQPGTNKPKKNLVANYCFKSYH